MYAPHVHVVVQPPKLSLEMGLAPPGELRTLRRAVYGLRVAPRKWPLKRDTTLDTLTWHGDDDTYYLKRCVIDTQVWRILKVGDETETFHGLLAVYVDDSLPIAEGGKLQENLERALRERFEISA